MKQKFTFNKNISQKHSKFIQPLSTLSIPTFSKIFQTKKLSMILEYSTTNFSITVPLYIFNKKITNKLLNSADLSNYQILKMLKLIIEQLFAIKNQMIQKKHLMKSKKPDKFKIHPKLTNYIQKLESFINLMSQKTKKKKNYSTQK